VFEKLAAVFARHNIEGEFIVESFTIYACKLAQQCKTKQTFLTLKNFCDIVVSF